MFWASRKVRLRVTIGLLLGIIIIGTVFARTHGASPDAGATYDGTVFVESNAGKSLTKSLSQVPIRFSVNAAATRAQDFRFNGGLPRACPGTTVGTLGAATSPIDKAGHFLVRIPILRAGSRVGTLILSGQFETVGRETGALETTFSSPGLSGCAARGGYNALTE